MTVWVCAREVERTGGTGGREEDGYGGWYMYMYVYRLAGIANLSNTCIY